MTPITTHVLDTAIGKPAAMVPVGLFRLVDGAAVRLGHAVTDEDGRARDLGSGWGLEAGIYRIRFDVAEYFARSGQSDSFYPEVVIDFRVGDLASHYHIPLLLSPFGYSTYRGS